MASRKKVAVKKKFVEPTRFIVTDINYPTDVFVVNASGLSEYTRDGQYKIEVIEKSRVVKPKISVTFD